MIAPQRELQRQLHTPQRRHGHTRDGTPAIDVAAVGAALCRRSFYDFVQQFWHILIEEEPVWNWHLRALCDLLQKDAERVFAGLPKKRDTIVNISPGTTKSTIFSVMFPAWVWLHMPHARIICGSHTDKLALNLSTKTRDVVECELYRTWFPAIQLRRDQNTKSHFQNKQGGMRYAVSVGGSVIGMHAHFIIIDDPIDPSGTLSDADLENANNWMTRTLPTRKVDKAVTVTYLIMQRLHQNDPTGHLLEKDKARPKHKRRRHVCLPAELDANVKPTALRKHYTNGLMDPVRLSASILADAKDELGEYGYAGQFLQNPIPLSGGMFKVDRIALADAPPEPWQYKKDVVRYWDKAGTAGGGAFTAGVKVCRIPNGKLTSGHTRWQYWILDVVRGQWDAGERENVIATTAGLDGYTVEIGVEQEPGSGGKESATNTMSMLTGHRVFSERPTGDKAVRAQPVAGSAYNHNVVCLRREWTEALIDELRYFPDSTYKDQGDALAGAFNRLARKRRKVGAL